MGAVVLDANFDGKPRAELPPVLGLLLRNGDAGDGNAVFFRRVLRHAAPAAADVEQLHARFEPEFTAGEIEFRLLRLIQRCGVLPVAATVNHALVQHTLEQIVAAIVMRLADLERPPPALQVDEMAERPARHLLRNRQPLVNACAKHARKHFIQPFGIPPAVHVGFAEAERAVRKHARKHARIMNPDVPGPIAIDPDIGLGEQPFGLRLQATRGIRGLR